MKWKRSKKAISESHKKLDNNQNKPLQDNDNLTEVDIAGEEDDSDIDISDDPNMDMDRKSDMESQLCEEERMELQRSLTSMDLSRNNIYLQNPQLHTSCFTEETNVINSAVSWH